MGVLILKVMNIDGELVPLSEEKELDDPLIAIKIWNLGSPDPNFTLDAHLKRVNYVDYFTGGDKPYLITGTDDHTAKGEDDESVRIDKMVGNDFLNSTRQNLRLREDHKVHNNCWLLEPLLSPVHAFSLITAGKGYIMRVLPIVS
uniref:Uncharacterized protein n=1 Tax=Lactuca sativa TaxID=4236 RepID=A0A9R1VZK2_LACSA|nr:hypothetical protein LSAT_V11C400166940 [Lactuca sativa]